MPRESPILTSFNAGEVSPLVGGRVDLQKYHNGCRKLRNFIASVQGPAIKRPGFRFVAEVKDSSKITVLAPFVFSNVQAYVLEFGDFYMRVYRDSAPVTDLSDTIDGVAVGSPTTITANGHPFSNGDRVVVTGVSGTVELNNREFRVANKAANTFELQDAQTGAAINSTGWGAWTSGGTVKRIYEIATPYAHADLPLLAYAQSADTLYLAHPSYAPRKLTRTGHTSWMLIEIPFDHPPMLQRNSDPDRTLFFEDRWNGSTNDVIGVKKTGEAGGHLAIAALTDSGSGRIRVTTSASHGLVTGNYVYIEGTTVAAVNDTAWRVLHVSATAFDLESSTYTTDGGLGKAHELRSLAAYVGQVRISAIASNGTGGTRFTTLGTDHGFQTNDQVIIHGCEAKHQFNGRTFTVTRISATQFDVTSEAPNGDAYRWPGAASGSRCNHAGLAVNASVLEAAGLFSATELRGYIGLYDQPASFYPLWANTGSSFYLDVKQVGGNVYTAIQDASGVWPGTPTTAETHGEVQPVHEIPGQALWDADVAERDAGSGVRWRFENDGKGYVRIAKYVNPGLVYVYVPEEARSQKVPFGACRRNNDTTAIQEYDETSDWAQGAFSTLKGFPRAVCFFEDRLWWAGTNANPQSIWASRIGDYENHRLTDDDESALLYTLNTDEVNVIEWMSPGNVLAIGTSGGEFIAAASSQEVAITPGNIRIVRHTNYGARSGARPLRVENVLLFIQRAGRKLREFVYDYAADTYQAADLTVLADHLTTGKLKGLAFQQEPLRIVWGVLEDGALLGMTYERAQEVVGWHKHPLGGTAAATKSLACIPHPTNPSDQLWAIVSRTIDGGTHQYVEFMHEPWKEGDALGGAIYADSALTYSGAATTVLSGLYHLRGQMVKILRGGTVDAEAQVGATGKLTVTSGTQFTVGLGYMAELEPNKLEAGSADGSSQGKLRRVVSAVLRLWQTGAGLKYGVAGLVDALTMKDEGDPASAITVSLWDGDTYNLPWPSGYDKDALIYVKHDQPTPCHIVAIMPQFAAQGRQ